MEYAQNQQQPMQAEQQHQYAAQPQQQAIQQDYSQGTNMNNQEWQSGLCNCGPCESCLLGTCLPCMRTSPPPDHYLLWVSQNV